MNIKQQKTNCFFNKPCPWGGHKQQFCHGLSYVWMKGPVLSVPVSGAVSDPRWDRNTLGAALPAQSFLTGPSC